MTTTPSPPDRIVLKAVPESLCIGDENVVLDISELQRTIYLGETLDTSVVKAYARSDGSLMNAKVAGTADLFGNTDWNLSEGLHDILLRVNASQTYGIRLYIDQIIRDRPEGSVSLQAQMIWPDAPLVGPYSLSGTTKPVFGPTNLDYTISPSFGPSEISIIGSPRYGPSDLIELQVPEYGPSGLEKIDLPEVGPSGISATAVYAPLDLRDFGDYGVQWEPYPGADSYDVILMDAEGKYESKYVYNTDNVIHSVTETTFATSGYATTINDKWQPMDYWRVHPVVSGVRDETKYSDFCLLNKNFVNSCLGVSSKTYTGQNDRICITPRYDYRNNGYQNGGAILGINIEVEVRHEAFWNDGRRYMDCKRYVSGSTNGDYCYTSPNKTVPIYSGGMMAEIRYRQCGLDFDVNYVSYNADIERMAHYINGYDVGVYGAMAKVAHNITTAL